MFYIDNVACMVPLSSTAISYGPHSAHPIDSFIVHSLPQRSIYTLSTVQKLLNSLGLSERFVVVGTQVNQEEEERESLKAVGVGT
jgi:hypothetical protein